MKISNLTLRLREALSEDESFSDITTKLLASFSHTKITAKVVAKQNGVFCGAFLLSPLFRLLDPKISVSINKKDGQSIKRGEILASLKGMFKAVVGGERLFLNLATHLSGIATLTRAYVNAVQGTSVAILDTRKTTPLWRDLEKFAVRCGGGQNHRFSLRDAVLVKDNHLELVEKARVPVSIIYGKNRMASILKKIKFFEMEAKTLDQVWQAIRCKADIILLDNMPSQRIKQAFELIKAARQAFHSPFPLVEVSGRVTIARARQLAKLGVDRISVGALTHSAPALDLSLEVTNDRV